jgi:hypothetical protein
MANRNSEIIEDLAEISDLDMANSGPAVVEDNFSYSEGTDRPPCEVVIGPAGSGKTTLIQERIKADPKGILLAATTGIAAVNLGDNVATIHSTLGFFDYESLADSYTNGGLRRRLIEISRKDNVHTLVIDEMSMMEARMVDLIWLANMELPGVGVRPLKFVLVGDFRQLAPVPDKGDPHSGKWAFEADCWEENFGQNITKLSRIWRQNDENFLAALSYARAGHGPGAAHYLQKAGVEFIPRAMQDFEGSSLEATNDEVDRVNNLALMKLPGAPFNLSAVRWIHGELMGRQPGEWKHIPAQMPMKLGAYVMILANNWGSKGDGIGVGSTNNDTYANGDCGWLTGWDDTLQSFIIKLKRTGQEVAVPLLTRNIYRKDAPAEWADRSRKEWPRFKPSIIEPPYGKAWYNEENEKWCLGAIRRFPIRLAWATTIHKSQGLSLDNVQINLRHNFLKRPAMVYVALSRARTPQGLRLIGRPEDIVGKCNGDTRCDKWI